MLQLETRCYLYAANTNKSAKSTTPAYDHSRKGPVEERQYQEVEVYRR